LSNVKAFSTNDMLNNENNNVKRIGSFLFDKSFSSNDYGRYIDIYV
jgi:hypothetical protein